MSIGITELILIIIIAIIVIKPEKLPEYIKLVKETINEAKKVTKEIKDLYNEEDIENHSDKKGREN